MKFVKTHRLTEKNPTTSTLHKIGTTEWYSLRSLLTLKWWDSVPSVSLWCKQSPEMVKYLDWSWLYLDFSVTVCEVLNWSTKWTYQHQLQIFQMYKYMKLLNSAKLHLPTDIHMNTSEETLKKGTAFIYTCTICILSNRCTCSWKFIWPFYFSVISKKKIIITHIICNRVSIQL